MGGKTSAKSINKYMSKTYDRVTLLVKKGKKDEIKAYCDSIGISVNEWINKLIDENLKL